MSRKKEGGTTLRDFVHSPATQLTLYLVVLMLLLVGLGEIFEVVRELYVPSDAPGGFEGFDALGSQAQGGLQERGPVVVGVMGLLTLLGAFLFAIPIVRIYEVTMRQEGYDKSFIRLLIALPVVVAAVVQIVRNDLALAFALAGIVAAVRFRTTVKDLQDAFFAFAAIAIGLAAGTRNFVLAAATSAVITALMYVVWRMNVGEVGPSLELPYGGVSLTEALVPGESHKGVVVGDEERAVKVRPADLDTLQEAIEKVAGYVRADALRKKKKYNTLCIGHADPDALPEAKELFEASIDDHSKRYVYLGPLELRQPDVISLIWLVRLKKSVDVGAMVEEFGCDPEGPLYAVELKPIKGLRKRIT